MEYFLGVDGGGTKVVGIVADDRGHLLGMGLGGGANTNFTSEEMARRSIFDAVTGAWKASGPPSVPPKLTIVTGPIPTGMVLEAVTREAGSDQVAHAGEGEGAWAAALAWQSYDCGVAVGAGTGSVSWGFNRQGEQAVASAWGAFLGDEGSGYWIAVEALRAIVRAEDGREPPTRLREALCKTLGIQSSLWELIPLLHHKGMSRREIAALCPVVAQAAREGDARARAIMAQAGKELALAAGAVIRRLKMAALEFGVVPFGSVFKAGEMILGPFRRAILRVAPLAQFIFPRYEPVVGALLIALQRGGVRVDDRLLATLEEGLHKEHLVRDGVQG